MSAVAGLAGFVYCLPDLLIINHRRFYQRHFPEVVAQWPLGGRYTSIAPYDDPDANSYAGRVNEAARHFWPMDPNIKENRSRRLATTDTLSLMFLGALVRLTGDVSSGWLLGRGLCGAAWLLALYLLIAELSGRRRMALAAAVFLTLYHELFVDVLWPLVLIPQYGFGPVAVGFKHIVMHTFWFLGNYMCNFGASRVVSPGLNYPPFLFASFAAWKAAQNKRGWAWLGGLLGGALVYVHADVWHVYMAAMGFFCAAWSYQRKRWVWPLWTSFALSLILSLPWIAANYPLDHEILMREMGVFTHAPKLSGLFFAAAAAACWRWHRGDHRIVYAGCVAGAIVLALESQILSGYTIDSMRFIEMGVTVGCAAAAGLWGRKAGESREWLWLAALLFLVAGGRSVSYAAQRHPYQGLPRDLEAAFSYLNRETPNDAVVASLGPLETMLIPVYSHDKTLIGSSYTQTCDVPLSELFQRIRLALRLYGIPESAFRERLSEREWQHPVGMERWNQALWENRIDWEAREWRDFFIFNIQSIPPAEVVARFAALEKSPLGVSAETDFIWVGPFERSLMTAGALKKLGSPVYQNATIALFRAP